MNVNVTPTLVRIFFLWSLIASQVVFSDQEDSKQVLSQPETQISSQELETQDHKTEPSEATGGQNSADITDIANVGVVSDSNEISVEAEGSNSDDQALTPHDRIQEITNELLAVIEQNKTIIDENPQDYYSAVGNIMDSIVDFKFIAKNVMGKNYYKKANAKQRDRFVTNFKQSLIETYAKGLANYTDEKIILLPPKEADEGKTRMSVRQEIHTGSAVIPLSFTMAQNKEGEWKMLNVIINGINLGKTLRSQFQQAMKDSGSLDTVIDNWAGNVDV